MMDWLDSRRSQTVYNARTKKLYIPELKWEKLTHEDLTPEYFAEIALFKDLIISFYVYQEDSFKLQIQYNSNLTLLNFNSLDLAFEYAKIYLTRVVKANFNFLWRSQDVRGEANLSL